jgi:hypothetical protein
VWRSLAILVMLVAAHKGLIKLKRDSSALQLTRRVFGVPLDAETRNSVTLLRALRREAQDRVRLRWWQRGELDKPRWRNLHDIIEGRIREAKENSTLGLVAATREASRLQLGAARTSELDTIEQRIWAGLEHGELESTQHEMLLRVLADARNGGAAS